MIQKEAKYTFFSNAHATFSNTDHMTGYKTSLNKFKKIEIISSIVMDKGLKLQLTSRKKPQKHSNSWRLNTMLLPMNRLKLYQGRNQNLSRNKYKWTHNSPKSMVHSTDNPEREVHSDTGLPKKDINK